MKNVIQDIEIEYERLSTDFVDPVLLDEMFFVHPDISHPVVPESVLQKDRNERLKMAVAEICIGQRIKKVLKERHRSVAWLARQLSMERTALYYIFRRNSINMELLLRISTYLGHNFIQDVSDVYNTYGL